MKILANMDLMIGSIFSESYDHRLSELKLTLWIILSMASFHPWGNRDSKVKWRAQDHTAYFNYFDSIGSLKDPAKLEMKKSFVKALVLKECKLCSPKSPKTRCAEVEKHKQTGSSTCLQVSRGSPPWHHACNFASSLGDVCTKAALLLCLLALPLCWFGGEGSYLFPTSTLFIHSSFIVAVVVFLNTHNVSQCIYFPNPELKEERYRGKMRDDTSEWVHI